MCKPGRSLASNHKGPQLNLRHENRSRLQSRYTLLFPSLSCVSRGQLPALYSSPLDQLQTSGLMVDISSNYKRIYETLAMATPCQPHCPGWGVADMLSQDWKYTDVSKKQGKYRISRTFPNTALSCIRSILLG